MFRQTPRNEKRTRFARLLYFGQRLVVTIINMFTHHLHSLWTVFECIPPTSTKRNASTLMAIRHRCSSDLVQYNSNQRFSGSPSSGSLTFQGFPKLRSSRNLEITHFGTSRVTSFAAPKKRSQSMSKGVSAGLLHVLVSKHKKKVDICSDSRSHSRLDGGKRQHVASNTWLPNEFTQLQVGHGPTCCMSYVHPCPEKPAHLPLVQHDLLTLETKDKRWLMASTMASWRILESSILAKDHVKPH